MKIAVFSDSHGYCKYMLDEMRKLSEAVTLDYIIHLGDLVQDAKILQDNFPAVPVIYVYGNCDYTRDIKDQEKEYELGGKRFFILHGHTRQVKYTLSDLKETAAQKNNNNCYYDIILYGHTHTPHKIYEKNHSGSGGTYIINPGSISANRDGSGQSYCMIDITGDILEANIVYL